MLPGVIVNGDSVPRNMGNLPKNHPCAVKLLGNRLDGNFINVARNLGYKTQRISDLNLGDNDCLRNIRKNLS